MIESNPHSISIMLIADYNLPFRLSFQDNGIHIIYFSIITVAFNQSSGNVDTAGNVSYEV